jgi:hypothetical protein
MSVRIGCLCLLLVVVSSWTDTLTDGSFRVASPTGTPSFGQEVFPISGQSQRRLSQQLEQAPYLACHSEMECAAGHPTEGSALAPLVLVPFVLSSSDFSCYVLMSLQR